MENNIYSRTAPIWLTSDDVDDDRDNNLEFVN